MYLSGLLKYLLWPAFIIAAWFIIKAALAYYEKKFPGNAGNPRNSESSEKA